MGVGGEDDGAYPQSLREMASREDLGLESIVTHVLPLEEVSEGIELAMRGEAVKVQLQPGVGPEGGP
jgi:Zn-dependent alcohol dehydrogenase